jgi:hypothetical protein
MSNREYLNTNGLPECKLKYRQSRLLAKSDTLDCIITILLKKIEGGLPIQRKEKYRDLQREREWH